MFNRTKKKNVSDAADTVGNKSHVFDDLPEWEELLPDSTDDSALPEYSFGGESAAQSQNSVLFSKDNGTYFDGAIDILQFPALRMAMGSSDDEQLNTPVEEYTAESDGEDGLSQLIRRYAELDEREEKESRTTHSQPGEDLPELFRQQSTGESDETEQTPPQEETLPEEFSMESEAQKHQEISGELFDYIDAITYDTNSMISQLDTARTSEPVVQYDPYNMRFNNKYDDTDEILSNTPEISLAPRYELNDGTE